MKAVFRVIALPILPLFFIGLSPSYAACSGKMVTASSFADPADVRAFRKCKKNGGADRQCFKFGDNAIGLWGDDTSDPRKAMCALPPGDWRPKWGGGSRARGKKINVTYAGRSVVCELRDTLPARPRNGAGIDLNPGAARALGQSPPFLLRDVCWSWAQ